MSLQPDYIIHLGDVYYAGTPDLSFFMPPLEETLHFLDLWPSTDQLASRRSFALNSNHEMYSGARGLMNDVINGDARFAAQSGKTYFALQYAGWTILGLDTAYYATSFYMDGSLGPENGSQAAWINNLMQSENLSSENVIVLTHHNGLRYDGATVKALWSEVRNALGGDPAAWYWGHVHNGVAYTTPNPASLTTIARCVGHGAIPFGDGWGLTRARYVDYYAHTPNPQGGANRVKNGFVLLTLASTGQVTEEFYEQDNPSSVYTTTYPDARP